MSFATLHKVVAYLIAGLGLVGLSLGGELPMITLVLFALAYVGSYFAEGALVRSERYSNAWTVAVVVVLMIQLARVINDSFSLSMLLEFAAFLQISRLFNRRTAVDYQQIAVLAFLHLIAATALSTSLVYAVVFFGFVIATPWMLALSHLRREIEGNYPSSGQGDEAAAAAIRRVLASKRVVGPGYLAGTALLTLPLFAMTLTIFFMVPRVGKGFLSLQRDSGDKVAGFSDTVQLGGFGLIRDDPTVVLRVTPSPMPTPPPANMSLRLRGTSFDTYDGRTWHREKRLPREIRRSGPEYPLRRWPRDSDATLHVVLDHLEETVVFMPERTVALSIAPRYVNGNEIGRRVVSHGPDEVRYADDDELGLIYTTHITADARETSESDADPQTLTPYLQVPPGHERVAALAGSITADATTDAERVTRLVKYLQEGKRFKYTLDLPDVGNKPPIEAFLFETKRGHCEYFSTALAIMARTINIPSRNVTGFIGGTYNEYGKYYAIKQGDAHSWTEVFIAGRGWVTADPTPPGALRAGANGFMMRMRALIDAMHTRWLTSVIAYDLRTQINTLRDLAHWASQFRSKGASGNGAVGDDKVGGNIPWRTVSTVVLVVIALIVIVLQARKRVTSGKRALSGDEHAMVQLYRELERVLDQRGCPRASNITPLEHARYLSEVGFPDSQRVAEITTRYMQVRYGAEKLRAQEAAELKAQLHAIKKGPRFDRQATTQAARP